MNDIDEYRVERAFRECLYKDEELVTMTAGPPPGAVLVEGITRRFGFHPERLEAKREQVKTWLGALPHQFQAGGDDGGGWSFLQACVQEDGKQWTGLHRRMEELFCLGIGLGLVECLLKRELWPALPGGMPYYRIVASDASRS